MQLATEMEGHPDNVAPAIYGNLVVASSVDGQVSAIVADFPECDFLAYIPNYELRTRDSRGVLPKKLSYKELSLLVLSPMWRLQPCWQETW